MYKYEIIRKDPWLEPYSQTLEKRVKRFKSEKKRLESFSGFSEAYKYYGEHISDGKTIIRELAPNASEIFLLCDQSCWNASEDFSFKRINEHGDWEIELDSSVFGHGAHYRILVRWPGGEGERIPAYARRVVQDPDTHIFTAQLWFTQKPYIWKHGYVSGKGRAEASPLIYEAHIGMAKEDGGIGSYRDFRLNVVPRIKQAGFNTVQFMALMEHPYYASFGYQVSSFFALSSKYGTPEEFKALVDECHNSGIKVIMDLIHSHAVKNQVEGISVQDGSEYLYFHSGPKGKHPAWDSRCFDYGKADTVNFLISNCRFWIDEYKIDGFRFDGVTSMLYYDHGLGASFDHYDKYFGENVDEDALLYLTLANDLIHRIKPDAITISEDMSGMPGMGLLPEEGGLGFDYRLTMGLPDYWIKTIKEVKDENWKVSLIWDVLNNRRHGEKHIAYSESHDQALVGDKTIIFRLMDAAMYSDMSIDKNSQAADRGIAYFKLINLLTFSAGGDGYLCFMGNEFGHPEWIDFPREGNGWSYNYARRQWSLADNGNLRYSRLLRFTSDMLKNCKACFDGSFARLVHCHDQDGVIAYLRGGLLFVISLNPGKSYTEYGIEADKGEWEMFFSTDNIEYDGHERLPERYDIHSQKCSDGASRLMLYIPSQSGQVFRRKNK